MAAEQYRPSVPTDHPQPEIQERAALAREAAWEIESLADALVTAAQDLEAEHLWIRGASLRARQLAQLIMAALDDKQESTANIRQKLTGKRSVVAEVLHG